jgi:hypothetical protein
MPPRDLPQARFEKTGSQLIARTWLLVPSNCARAAS